MRAKWQDFCLTTPEGRTLGCVREDKDGWVWHARNSYGRMDTDMWFGLPDMSEEQAMKACEEKLKEEFLMLKEVFE